MSSIIATAATAMSTSYSGNPLAQSVAFNDDDVDVINRGEELAVRLLETDIKALTLSSYGSARSFREVVEMYQTALQTVYHVFQHDQFDPILSLLFDKLQVILSDPKIVFQNRFLKKLCLVLTDDQIFSEESVFVRFEDKRIRILRFLSHRPEKIDLTFCAFPHFLTDFSTFLDEIRDVLTPQTSFEQILEETMYDQVNFSSSRYKRNQVIYFGLMAPCFSKLAFYCFRLASGFDLEKIRRGRSILKILYHLIEQFHYEELRYEGKLRSSLNVHLARFRLTSAENREVKKILKQTGLTSIVRSIRFD